MLGKLSLGLLALAGSGLAADLDPIEVKGSKFFFKNGTQFFMKGVAYQQDTSAAGNTNDKTDSYIDPLADKDNCKRDIPLLAELGTNTIRTYAIDPSKDHSDCMKMLNDAGIYVISDLGQPKLSINRNDTQWDTELFDRYKKVVDELGQYSNVIGFFAGNEVSNDKKNTGASAYVKAAVRDTKKYIKDNSKRWMGVGYAANDDKDIRSEIADYFNCGPTEDAIDFWGYNIYSWCGDSNMEKSGYNKQIKFFEDYSVPVFFAEYGCNLPDGAAKRKFQETGALYNDQMTKVFSGGIVYMYFQEENDYGLVKVNGGKAKKLDDFDDLKKQVLQADPKGVDMSDYSSSSKPADCPGLTDNWQANKNLPPTPDESLCKCMVQSRECVPKDGISAKEIKKTFDYICDEDPKACVGINGNAKSGVYGSYSMCEAKEKLAFVLDAYYQNQDKAADACDFDGAATTQEAQDESKCSDALSKASDHNKQAATATTALSNPSTTSDPSDDGDDESAAMTNTPLARLFSVGDYAVGLYAIVAVVVGGGMVAL